MICKYNWLEKRLTLQSYYNYKEEIGSYFQNVIHFYIQMRKQLGITKRVEEMTH